MVEIFALFLMAVETDGFLLPVLPLFYVNICLQKECTFHYNTNIIDNI